MKRFWYKRLGHFVDALAWNGMHAIARRQEPHLTVQLPRAHVVMQHEAALLFPQPNHSAASRLNSSAWRQHGKTWRQDFAFVSPVLSEYETNNVVHVHAYAPEPAMHSPAVIVLHGLMNFTTAAYAPFLRAIVAAGASAYILELPYHHQRTPRGSLSGDLFHTIDLAQTQHAVQQAVADVRTLMLVLRGKGAPQIGLLGFSLGAWIGGLVACCEPELDYAFFGMPPNHLNELVWHTALGAQLAQRFAEFGWTSETTAAFYRALDPLSYQPVLPCAQIQLYAAEFDSLIALEKVYALQRAWGQPHLRIYPHGHLTIMLSRQLHRDFRLDFAQQLDSSRKARRCKPCERGCHPMGV